MHTTSPTTTTTKRRFKRLLRSRRRNNNKNNNNNNNNDTTSEFTTLSLPIHSTIIEWHVSILQTFAENDVLLTYSIVEDGKSVIHEYSSAITGVLTKIYMGKNECITEHQQIVALMSICPHDTIYNGLCVRCGGHANHSEDLHHSLITGGVHKTLHLSHDAVKEMRDDNHAKLLAEKKLVLILDIDHTLLHATDDPRAQYCVDNDDLKRDLHYLPVSRSWVKLRHGLLDFLRSMNDLYDIHVFTMGLRRYAASVLDVIDPDHSIIKHRVVARDDVKGHFRFKSFQRLFPCDESMVVIVDDRVDVWQETPDNVIQVLQYRFFEGFHELYDPNSGHPTQIPSTTLSSTATAFHRLQSDNVLQSVSQVLRALHTAYFSSRQAPVPRLLHDIRSSVLSTCRIVFSGVYPKTVVANMTQAWRLAESFGAQCFESFETANNITHVVAARDKSDKVNAARNVPGVHIVYVTWLYESVVHFHRADEQQHPIPSAPRPRRSLDGMNDFVEEVAFTHGQVDVNSLVEACRVVAKRKRSESDDDMLALLSAELDV